MKYTLFVLFALLFAVSSHAKVNKEFVILIHAGHGGTDAGAVAKDGTTEKALNLAYTLQLESLAKAANFKVVLCRDEDENFSLEEREALIALHKADVFLSIHFDFNSLDATQKGMEVTVATDQHLNENRVLGKFLGAELYLVEGMKFKGVNTVPQKTNAVKGLSVPSAMLDLGMMSNEQDLAFIKSDTGKKLICEKLVNAIQRYKNFLDGNK